MKILIKFLFVFIATSIFAQNNSLNKNKVTSTSFNDSLFKKLPVLYPVKRQG